MKRSLTPRPASTRTRSSAQQAPTKLASVARRGDRRPWLDRAQHPDAFDSWGFYLADVFLSAMPEEPRANAAIGPLVADALPNPPGVRPLRVAQTIDGSLEDYAGRYEIAPNVFATMSAADGRLFVLVPGRGEAEMFQFARDRFFLRVAEAELEIERGPGGAIVAATLVEGGRRMRAERVR